MYARLEADLDGRKFVIESGKFAKQANGATVVTFGETMVLATAVAGGPRGLGADDVFLPLTVDYREKTCAAGKFPGGFIKREGRPKDKETLTMRLTDRPLRPLFPDGFHNDLLAQSFTLSHDLQNDADILVVNGTSAAFTVSDIPFHGPVGCVRVGRIGGRFVVNPTNAERADSSMDLVVAGTEKAITMVEGSAFEEPEEVILGAFDFALPHLRKLCQIQSELARQCGRAKIEFPLYRPPDGLFETMKAKYVKSIQEKFFIKEKMKRNDALSAIKKQAVKDLCVEGDPKAPKPVDVKTVYDRVMEEQVRGYILENRRSDGRTNDDIRPIACEVGILPRAHGTALFTRGETQALVTVTLGTVDDEQRVDGLEDEYKKKFMLHYNFPGFSVGEAKPPRGPGRREIGHGDLAERSLEPCLPEPEQFPYTIRVVSDILESNGSSSMASVCGGTLAMLDAGVPMTRPVAGIAMGLVTEGSRAAVVTDILGSEDAYGDMDFKIAGSDAGVTGIQMDIKMTGIDLALMKSAMEKARVGRLKIIAIMRQAIGAARPSVSQYAPRLAKIKINPEKIGMLIGPGGKMIREIQSKTGAEIEVEDDGTVTISAKNEEALKTCREWVESITQELIVGKIYPSRVVSIKDFGCFVATIPGGQEGLVHVSELSTNYVSSVGDAVKVGMEVPVKVLSIDDNGRVRLSIKAAQVELGIAPPPAPAGEGQPAGAGSRPPGGGGYGGPRGGPPRQGGGGGRGPR